jgi:hypothetical protein
VRQGQHQQLSSTCASQRGSTPTRWSRRRYGWATANKWART